MKSWTLIIVVWIACSFTYALRCYKGTGDDIKEQECGIDGREGIVEVCIKMADGNGIVVRSCAIVNSSVISEFERCKEVPHICPTCTLCGCSTDLCNSASFHSQRTAKATAKPIAKHPNQQPTESKHFTF